MSILTLTERTKAVSARAAAAEPTECPIEILGTGDIRNLDNWFYAFLIVLAMAFSGLLAVCIEEDDERDRWWRQHKGMRGAPRIRFRNAKLSPNRELQ